MKNKMLILITVILCGSLLFAANTKVSDMTLLVIGNDDFLLYGVNDPNGTPVDRAIGLEELSLGITQIGIIATGTWQGAVVDHERGGLEADINTYTGLVAISGGSTSEVDAKSELEAQIADVADFAEADGDTWTGVHDAGGATSFEIPNDESADGTLTALGQVHIRGDEDTLSAHLGAGGEVAGEASMSFLKSVSVSYDPGTRYDTTDEVFLFTVDPNMYPNGITIIKWRVSCKKNPDVEMDMNLGYSDTDWDMADDPNLIDVLDTTAGRSSEATKANINGGVAIAVTKVIFLYHDADPEGTCDDLSFEMWFYLEAD